MQIRFTMTILGCIVGSTLVQSLPVDTLGQTAQQVSQVAVKGKNGDDVVPEEPESTNPQDQEARKAKNKRYSAGGADLTRERSADVETFAEHIWPAVEVIPASESAVVVKGTVVKAQPYFSTDHSRIYTELSIQVDGILKGGGNGRLSAAETMVIDLYGGAITLRTGRVVRDGIFTENLGKPQLGNRYLFFAKKVNNGKDTTLIKSYELRDGHVFTNDFRPSRQISALSGVPKEWASETAFIEAVSKAIKGS